MDIEKYSVNIPLSVLPLKKKNKKKMRNTLRGWGWWGMGWCGICQCDWIHLNFIKPVHTE